MGQPQSRPCLPQPDSRLVEMHSRSSCAPVAPHHTHKVRPLQPVSCSKVAAPPLQLSADNLPGPEDVPSKNSLAQARSAKNEKAGGVAGGSFSVTSGTSMLPSSHVRTYDFARSIRACAVRAVCQASPWAFPCSLALV